jgi:hypothetical protein
MVGWCGTVGKQGYFCPTMKKLTGKKENLTK